MFRDGARDGVGLLSGLERNGVVRGVRTGSICRIDCPLDRAGERFRLSGLDAFEHDLMALDDVIEGEMPTLGCPVNSTSVARLGRATSGDWSA